MRSLTKVAIVVSMALAGLWAGPALANVSGAIFTTTENGTRVNANIYPSKEAVYLDGGPGPNAPAKAAALDPGWYYFQVTDPPGKKLLSVDPIESRMIRISDDGVIVEVGEAKVITKYKGKSYGTHKTGIDEDHKELGAITVQLMPYEDTPNRGGVYKVWVTPCKYYDDKNPAFTFGFDRSWSKTDNFKVKGRPDSFITIRKIDDQDADGCWDTGEPEIGVNEFVNKDGDIVPKESGGGWPVNVYDPDGTIPKKVYTPWTETVYPGKWKFVEDILPGWWQTFVIVDGVYKTPISPEVLIEIISDGETHTIVYGNARKGCITAWKWYDQDCEGDKDAGDPMIEGWKIQLIGPSDSIWTTSTTQEGLTGKDGKITWKDLYPGTYLVKEIFPIEDCWVASTVTQYEEKLASGGKNGPNPNAFGNYCIGEADFNTKGYWHNKNGLTELTEWANKGNPVIPYVNGLDPYKEPSPYFGDGDEPFDGKFENGDPVEAAYDNDGLFAAAGTWQSEVSHFLVDPNAGSDQREQLAQQLLAFIFNVHYRLGSESATIYVNGKWVVAGKLIQDAIDAWNGLPNTDRNAMQVLLDQLNNNNAVKYILAGPCPFTYP
ncbi:MAG: prealbumin-like fold domain-containing protein [Armatimonadota bacterium]